MVGEVSTKFKLLGVTDTTDAESIVEGNSVRRDAAEAKQ